MREQLERRSFLILLAAVTIAFGFILEPFWSAIFWACAVAVIFSPLQSFLSKKIGERPNLNALITLTICMLIVVIPVIFLSMAFVQEGIQLYQRIDSGEIDPKQMLLQLRDAFPVVDKLLVELGINPNDIREQVTSAVQAASKFLAKETLAIGQNTFSFFISLALMMYLTFFLLRDGSKLKELLIKALPIGDEREHALFQKFVEVTRATVKGNLVVAIVQGALGGIIFWILDIPAPLLWGVIMAFLSLIPAVGAALVWFPAGLYLYATGAWVSATVLMAYGAIIIGLADNVLRPILVGRDTKLPDYVVLFSTIGGISLFGINGFVIGPLVAALFMAMWQIFMTDFNHHTTDN
ncbi:AI-2E family transporter [Pseudidiomarina donghaiensis]|uniref:AI-2E family transporter n=1 Tax=Pseudidiomarina donghaiensis TaxID=519452 RepID=A0A432XFF1_9GAMM|nr:AI-2E family transporter [Pseudidiomarina donghaiensis]RUO47464.1 AI-2E family transporter [Pseudidiomarina donghaiensis]SFV23071.1 Predicted PurR-regulated permease PerM [Pseudidiomarina donghaiensis]